MMKSIGMACKLLRKMGLLCKYQKITKDVRFSCILCGEKLSYVRLRNLQRTNKLQVKSTGLIPKPIHRELTVVSTEVVKVTLKEIKSFLKARKLPFEEGHACLKMNCPICQHSLGTNQRDDRGEMYINITTGMFICYNCKQTGSWQLFRDHIEALQKKSEKVKTQVLEQSSIFLPEEQLASIQMEFDSFIPLPTSNKTELLNVLEKFNLEHLQPEILEKYNIRMSSDRTALYFPFHCPDGSLVGFQSLQVNVSESVSDEVVTSFYPRIPVLAVFGLIDKMSQPEVVLTSSPLDVMTINQETNQQSLSLPRAISALPLEVLPVFEKFSKVTFWFGNTLQDWDAARTFSHKLGQTRCFFVRPSKDQPSPFTALQERLNLVKILKESQIINHKFITTFTTLRSGVLTELSDIDQLAGIKWMRFPELNKLMKGHRRGELTIFTGRTGVGKTTFLSESSLDLCIQGVNTLWGSFEIPNIRLAVTMLKQFSQLPLEKHLEKFDYWADKFEQIPLYFMTFFGQQSNGHVFEAMAHAIYVHDIQHIIVDNIQFMMGTDSSRGNMDRFYHQDLLIADFRKFSTQHNCHITLVIHPRKEENQELGTNSVFGGAKATQEADNVLILQEKKNRSSPSAKYLEKPMHAEYESIIFSEPFRPQKMDYATGVQILDCLLLKENDPEKWNQVMSLKSDIATLKEIPKHSKLIEKAVNFIKYIRGSTQFTMAEIEHVYGVIFTNAYGKHFDDCDDEYLASHKNSVFLFWYGSAVLHSCIPNASSSILPSGHFVIKAAKEIKKGDRISVAKVNVLLGTVARRQCMKDHLIACSCSRCADPTELGTYYSAIVCQVCRKGHLLLDDPTSPETSLWRCDDCGNVQLHEDISTFLDEIQKELEGLMMLGQRTFSLEIIEKINNFLKNHDGNVLHPNHYLIVWAGCHTTRKISTFCLLPGEREYLGSQMILNVKKGVAIADAFLPGKTLFRGACLAYLYNVHFTTFTSSTPLGQMALHNPAVKEAFLRIKPADGYDSLKSVLKEATNILNEQPKRNTASGIALLLAKDIAFLCP